MKKYYQLLNGHTFRVKDVRSLLALREGEYHYSFKRDDPESTEPLPIDYVAVIKGYGWVHIGYVDYNELSRLLLEDNDE